MLFYAKETRKIKFQSICVFIRQFDSKRATFQTDNELVKAYLEKNPSWIFISS